MMELKEVIQFGCPIANEVAVKTADPLTYLNIRYALAEGLAVGARAKKGVR